MEASLKGTRGVHPPPLSHPSSNLPSWETDHKPEGQEARGGGPTFAPGHGQIREGKSRSDILALIECVYLMGVLYIHTDANLISLKHGI